MARPASKGCGYSSRILCVKRWNSVLTGWELLYLRVAKCDVSEALLFDSNVYMCV